MENVAKQQQAPQYSRELASLIGDYLRQWKYPVCVIYGNPDTGKTDTALLIAEIGLNEGLLDYFASNVNTYGHGERLTSLQDVDYWFKHQVGRKLFILDEAGIHDDSRSPLSTLNRKIRHEIFIIRKFKGHVIFILQELEDLDKWKNSELTGMVVKKQVYDGEYIGKIKCKWMEDLVVVRDFPRATIPFDTYDISPFTLERQLDEDELQLKGIPNQVAYLYATTGNFSVICKTLKEQTGQDWKPMQVKRALQQYIRQTLRADESA
ncbi:MAG: hypothetical protein QXX34_03510 [Candidatus Bathyarchaeia archaeon]